MRRLFSVLLSALMLVLLLTGCGTKAVHCDHCGKEIKISSSSEMDDSWILYCRECEKELGLDKVVEENTEGNP